MKQFRFFLYAILAAALCACGGDSLSSFRNLPPEADPVKVGNAIAAQFLSTDPAAYAPEGYDGEFAYGWDRYVTYPILSLWTNSLEFARNSGNDSLETVLIKHFEPFYGPRKHQCNKNNHVDLSIFGAVPLEIYILNGDARAREMGIRYADRQWSAPVADDLGDNGNFDYETQQRLFADGYSPQTRFWIDDMYMIGALQTQAYRATGDMKYIDRAAKEMAMYLDTLQLSNGLFYHSPDVHFVWGRGDGWMAVGLTEVLHALPKDSPYYKRIMKGYKKMMKSLLRYRNAEGLWNQLIDQPDFWTETSGSAMFTYAFIRGVKEGWLPARTYAPAARKAWLALIPYINNNGDVTNICVGTGKKNDFNYYLDRPKMTGDYHGQGPYLWCAAALLEN